MLQNTVQTVQSDPRAIISTLSLWDVWSIMSCQRLSSLAIMQKDTKAVKENMKGQESSLADALHPGTFV